MVVSSTSQKKTIIKLETVSNVFLFLIVRTRITEIIQSENDVEYFFNLPVFIRGVVLSHKLPNQLVQLEFLIDFKKEELSQFDRIHVFFLSWQLTPSFMNRF